MFVKRLSLFVTCSLIAFSLLAQTKPNEYTSSWKKIDSLINKKGLPQSALVEVNKIYASAKAEKNDVQVIRALIYRMLLQEMKEENSAEKNIVDLEKEIASSSEPAKSILTSMAAEKYWMYFQQRRWQLYNRTQTTSFKKDDVATWGISDFHSKIAELYLASLRNEKILQQTGLTKYNPILVAGNTRQIRPTLFDLLAHRALAYFKNDERTINRPVYAFEINDSTAFADAARFVEHRFVSSDSLSLHFKALQLYQRVLRFHLNDKQPDALIDADIDRLEFVQAHAVIPGKERQYKESLERLIATHGNVPASHQASYLIAQIHANKARQYTPFTRDSTSRFEYLAAKAILEKIIATNIKSEGWTNSKNLLNEILRKELRFETEKVNVPGQPFRVYLSYRNFAHVDFRVVKVDKSTREKLGENTWDEKYWRALLQLPVTKSFSQALPDTRDHQSHSVEIKADALPVGEYALIASVNKDFGFEKNNLALQFFYVSNISYINNGWEYFVLHRETGQPLAQAGVQVWQRYYDYPKQKYSSRQTSTARADHNGYVKLDPPSNQRNSDNSFRLELKHGEDYLFLDDYEYHYFPGEPNPNIPETKSTFLFTDRSIYRPRQIVYFKGIIVSRHEKEKTSSIVPDLKTRLVLYDVNGQKVDSLEVTTNEYGSYSGRFTLPTGILNGTFHISDEQTKSEVYFSVEEYKRPKFVVEIKKPSGTYRVNDSINVIGNARAYAGNTITEAKVRYRIVRKTLMPLWKRGYGRSIWPPRPQDQMEIAHGETATNSNGDFSIPFTAVPDNSIDKKDQPVFYYEVTADVTDLNGETRSGTTTIAVAYQALQVKIDLPEKMRTDSLRNLKISTTNLNDIFEKSTVTVTIHSLQVPSRIFRQRYWQKPDQFVMTQEEYYRFFPYDLYNDEDDPTKWRRLSKVYEKTDTTSITSSFPVATGNLTAGWYVIEALTKDKYGEEVKTARYIQLYNQVTVSSSAFAQLQLDKTFAEPGETFRYRIGTNLENAFIIHDIVRDGNKQRLMLQSNQPNQLDRTLSVSANDYAGIALNIAAVKHNRIYSEQVELDISSFAKQLNISFETFRDKTLPGSDEKWKVKISGYKGDRVAAELLTAMYDASLDQFQPHQWTTPQLLEKRVGALSWTGQRNFSSEQSLEKFSHEEHIAFDKRYDQLIFSGSGGYGDRYREGRVSAKAANGVAPPAQRRVGVAVEAQEASLQQDMASVADTVALPLKEAESSQSAIQIRKNFNETAFFFPDLKTDSSGNIEFTFTMPEALTQWKWMLLAHTKDLAFGRSEKTVVTQKELMVQPNAPRFIREGDRMDFSGKIVNLSGRELTGQVELQLIDPTTNQSVDGWFRNVFPNQYFTAAAGQSVPVSFSIEVPFQYNRPVIYRVIASSGLLKDGEEMMLPVVSNQLLVTESMPLPMRGNASKHFKFEKLLQSGESETLSHHSLTVEFTSNPVWYAVQALPYLMEYPYECSEQTFNRFYANAIAFQIINSAPRIKTIFERWKTTDTAALMSALQKNQELKSVILEETPWVMQAQNEAQQKKNIALLFDMVRMSGELESSLNKLQEMQVPGGGFVWFKGGPDDRYITQYIITGIGRLQKLNAIPERSKARVDAIVKKALVYLDSKIRQDYENLVRRKIKLDVNNLGYLQVQFLYMRSFFTNGISGENLKAHSYYRKQMQQYWLQQNRYMQGMIALSLHRTGDLQTAKAIAASLKQNAIVNEESGMYWKEVTGGYYWFQAPVESQALLIEAFTEVAKDPKAIDDMKTWLLKQKQTQNWRTTKATADACYALLLQGGEWLSNTPEVRIVLGDKTIRNTDQPTEAGTGYFKTTIEGKSVKPAMGDVQVFIANGQTSASSPSWGAVYWQYFENLEKIKPASTPLNLVKKLFIEKNSDRGPVLTPVNEGEILKVGDKIKVRIELRADRDMEYVHMKDMRGACMEPVNVISQYKWQGGLGYYETTRDASTNFFFNWLPKGTYVFEYPMFVTHAGTYSNGITTIQCMYAPEFTSHSEGVKVNVE